MELTTGLLILVGILVLYVIYLQLRLAFAPRQTVVVMPQPADESSGCGVAAFTTVLIIVALVLAAIFGLPAIG